MDAAVLENMWKVIGPEDQLWILGDFAFGSKAKDSAYVEQIFNQLPGAERHLVIGRLAQTFARSQKIATAAPAQIHLFKVTDNGPLIPTAQRLRR